MSFQKKYYYSFGSLNNNSYTVELWQNTGATLTAEQITGDNTPFTISYPTTSNKFDMVRGCGCDLNLLSTTSLKFIGLYTADMMEYQIKLYSDTGTTLLWIGYLDSELYSEPFAEKNNYTVSLTGNDGLALLERLDYLQADGSKYTGFSTNWTIITTILGKLGLAWNNLYCGLSTTSSQLVSGNILEKTYSYNENYYDEDGIAMSCREVLETILQAFSAYIQIINGNVYITDVNNLAANTSATFYKYNGSTFADDGTSSLSFNLGDVSTIKFASSEQTLNILSPINKQKITFSPYIDDTLIEYDANKDTFSGTTSTVYYGQYPYTWSEKQYSTSDSWSISGFLPIEQQDRFRDLIGSGDNKDEADRYLVLEKTDSTIQTLTYIEDIPKIVVITGTTQGSYVGDWVGNVYPESIYSYSSGDVVSYNALYYLCDSFHYPDSETPPPNAYFTLTDYSIVEQDSSHLFYLKIEAKGYTRTTDNMGDTSSASVYSSKLRTKLVLGDKQYDSVNRTWNNSGYLELSFVDKDKDGAYQQISDKWLDVLDGCAYVPLFYGFTGTDITFSIYRYYAYNKSFGDITSSTKDFRIKDIKISIVDNYLVDINTDDVEYVSYINKLVKDDGEDITLKLGTNLNHLPVCKGGIIGYKNSNYFYLQNFTRNGATDILENLLARSIVSNYTNRTIEIQCSINKINSLFGYLTYSNYWSGIKFGIQGADIDFHEDTIDLTLQEICADTLSIQKNY